MRTNVQWVLKTEAKEREVTGIWVKPRSHLVCSGLIGRKHGTHFYLKSLRKGITSCGIVSHDTHKHNAKFNHGYIIVSGKDKQLTCTIPGVNLDDVQEGIMDTILEPKSVECHVLLFGSLPLGKEETPSNNKEEVISSIWNCQTYKKR